MVTNVASTSSSGEGSDTPTEAGDQVHGVIEVIAEESIDLHGHEEGFVLFARQVLKHSGTDRKEMWQLFCIHFTGMMRWINYEPDMNLLSYEQQILLEDHISR